MSRRSVLRKGSSRLIFAMKGMRRRFLSIVSPPLRRPMARKLDESRLLRLPAFGHPSRKGGFSNGDGNAGTIGAFRYDAPGFGPIQLSLGASLTSRPESKPPDGCAIRRRSSVEENECANRRQRSGMLMFRPGGG
jgi:hypothetical protein